MHYWLLPLLLDTSIYSLVHRPLPQKAEHKLKFTPNAKPAITYVPLSPDSSLGSPNKRRQRTLMMKSLMDVVEMTSANPDPTLHTHPPTPPPTPHTPMHTHTTPTPHTHHLPLLTHPHRLVWCHIFTEGQDRGDEEESQDGARPGGGPAHQQWGTAGIPRVLRPAPPPLHPPGSQTTGTTWQQG